VPATPLRWVGARVRCAVAARQPRSPADSL